MNFKKVKAIIEFYKKNFQDISNMEIYKWRAVNHFQANWDIEAEDFAAMLEASLSRTQNLLTSMNYYPRKMMVQYAELNPQEVRDLFRKLYDESNEDEADIGDKFDSFRLKTETLNKEFFATQKHREMYKEKDGLSYQRHNAFMVYLTLRFPDRYFFYRFGELKEIVKKIESPYEPKKGANGNLHHYLWLCELLKDEIVQDKELIRLHKQRLTENEYADESLNLLTQDVIYAAVNHFKHFESSTTLESALKRLEKVNRPLVPSARTIVSKGGNRKIDYVERQKANQKTGKLGEELIFEYEREKLKARGSTKQPEWISEADDGAGYDIKSYNENDEEIYIEVKTTTQNCEKDFFITANELETSKKFKEKYRLYRVYNFDLKNQTAKFKEHRGSLEDLCMNPILYSVRVEEDASASLVEIES